MKVGIAGAGIMGRLLAFALVNEGHQVELFDQDEQAGQMSCSMAAAGLLTPVAELEKSEQLIYKLGEEALARHWPEILQHLGGDIYFQKCGSLVVSHPGDNAELQHFIARIHTKLDDESASQNVLQELTPEALSRLEPELSKFAKAYYFPTEGQLDNQALLKALGNYLVKNNISWHTKTIITQIRPKVLHANGEAIEFDLVFDCRGLGAKSIFSDLHSVRGELIWLHAPDVTIKHPIRFIHPRYSLYLVPRPGNIYLIGASEIHGEDRSQISVKTTLELLSAAYYLHPAFAEARIVKTITQCRPTLANYLPSIKYAKGLIAINGLYRHGFLIAPTLVNDLMQFLKYGVSSLSYSGLWEKYYDSCEIQ